MRNQTLVLTFLMLVAIVLSSCGVGDGAGTGTVAGVVTVGPLCPVEPCRDPPDVLSGRAMVFERDGVEDVGLPLSSDGSFSGELEAGTYLMRLDECQWLGCAQSLPREVTIEAGQTTSVDVDIDTGIR